MNKRWNYILLDSVIDWQAKSTIKSGDGLISGKYKMFICSDSEHKYYNSFLVDREALVFGTGGKASIHYCKEPFAYSTDVVVACAKEPYNLKFLYYYLRQNNLQLLQKDFSGSGLQHTSKKKIGKVLIPDIAISEQNKIVSRIEELFSSLDNAVETLQKTKKRLAVYRQAVLKEAFASIRESGTANIESLCQNIVDCPHSTPKWTREGYLCLRTTNFKRGKLDLSEKRFVSKETFDERNTRLVPLPGDVLYSREGAILGIACIIPKDTYVCLGQRMMLLRPGEALNNRFLMHYLNSPALTNFVASKTGGSASPHVNVGDIKAFMIPCPGIHIQEKIAMEIDNKMSVCDNIEQTVNTALAQAEAMRQSILREAFEGRL